MQFIYHCRYTNKCLDDILSFNYTIYIDFIWFVSAKSTKFCNKYYYMWMYCSNDIMCIYEYIIYPLHAYISLQSNIKILFTLEWSRISFILSVTLFTCIYLPKYAKHRYKRDLPLLFLLVHSSVLLFLTFKEWSAAFCLDSVGKQQP